MLFLLRLAFWMGLGLSALYLNGKLHGIDPSLARRSMPAPSVSLATVRDVAADYCSHHLATCVRDARALDALATAGGAQPSPSVASARRR